MTIFTIGHSNYDVDDFIKLLLAHKINCVIDVRSSPYSKYAPQFNREGIAAILKRDLITYLFMGDVLGARYSEKSLLYPDGKVDFAKVRLTTKFKAGINRVLNGMQKGYRIALMCSEKEPFDCHRFVLVSYALWKAGANISHILEDGALVEQEKLHEKMLRENLQMDLFLLDQSDEERLEQAYRERNKVIAYNASLKEEEKI